MGIINKIIPQYTRNIDGIHVSKPKPEPVVLDDFYDALFNKNARAYLTEKYGNPVLGTIGGELDYIGSIFDKDNWGKFGPGMNILSHFGRTLDKTEDFLIGGVTEGINAINQINPVANSDHPHNPLKNIFINDEDYTGNRLFAAMGNSVAQLAGDDVKLNESDFGKAWIPANIGAELFLDPGLLGSRIARTATLPSAAKYFGQELSNLDWLATKAAWETTLPGSPELLKRAIRFLMQLTGNSSAARFANAEFPQDDVFNKEALNTKRLTNNGDMDVTGTGPINPTTPPNPPLSSNILPSDWREFMPSTYDLDTKRKFLDFLNLGNEPYIFNNAQDILGEIAQLERAYNSKYSPLAMYYVDNILDNMNQVNPEYWTLPETKNMYDELKRLKRRLSIVKSRSGANPVVDISKDTVKEQFEKLNNMNTTKEVLIDRLSDRAHKYMKKYNAKLGKTLATKNDAKILTPAQKASLDEYNKASVKPKVIDLETEAIANLPTFIRAPRSADEYNLPSNVLKMWTDKEDIIIALDKNIDTDDPIELISARDYLNTHSLQEYREMIKKHLEKYEGVFDLYTKRIAEDINNYLEKTIHIDNTSKYVNKQRFIFNNSVSEISDKYWKPIANMIQSDYIALSKHIPSSDKNYIDNLLSTTVSSNEDVNNAVHAIIARFTPDTDEGWKNLRPSKNLRYASSPYTKHNVSVKDYVEQAQSFSRQLDNYVHTVPSVMYPNSYSDEFKWIPNFIMESYIRFKPYAELDAKFNFNQYGLESRENTLAKSPGIPGVVRKSVKIDNANDDAMSIGNAFKDGKFKALTVKPNGQFIGYNYMQPLYKIFKSRNLTIDDETFIDLLDYSNYESKHSKTPKYAVVENDTTKFVSLKDGISKNGKLNLGLAWIKRLKTAKDIVTIATEYNNIRNRLSELLHKVSLTFTDINNFLDVVNTTSAVPANTITADKFIRTLSNYNRELNALIPSIHQTYDEMDKAGYHFTKLNELNITATNPQVNAWKTLTGGFFKKSNGNYINKAGKKANVIDDLWLRNDRKYRNDFVFGSKELYDTLNALASNTTKNIVKLPTHKSGFVDIVRNNFKEAYINAVRDDFDIVLKNLKEFKLYGKDLFKLYDDRTSINYNYDFTNNVAKCKNAVEEIKTQLQTASPIQLAKAYVLSEYPADTINYSNLDIDDIIYEMDYTNIVNTSNPEEAIDQMPEEIQRLAKEEAADEINLNAYAEEPVLASPPVSAGGGGGQEPPHNKTTFADPDEFNNFNPNMSNFSKPKDVYDLVTKAKNIAGANSVRLYNNIYKTKRIYDHIRLAKFLGSKLSKEEVEAIIRAFESKQDIKIDGNLIKDLALSNGWKAFVNPDSNTIRDIRDFTDLINTISKYPLLTTDIREVNGNTLLYVYFSKDIDKNLRKALKNLDSYNGVLPAIAIKNNNPKALDSLRQWAIDNNYPNIIKYWDYINQWYEDFARNINNLRQSIGLDLMDSGYIHHAMINSDDAAVIFNNELDLGNTHTELVMHGENESLDTVTDMKEVHANQIAAAIRKKYKMAGMFGAYDVQRKFVGNIDELNALADTQLFSTDLEYITRSAYTNGFLDNSMFQTFLQITNNPYFHLQQLGFKDSEQGVDDLYAILTKQLDNGKESGNSANFVLAVPVYKNGKIDSLKRFNIGSKNSLRKAIHENAIIIPTNLMHILDFPIQKYSDYNNKVWNAWNKIISFGKAAILTNPGFIIGNAMDAYSKLILNLGAKYDMNLVEIFDVIRQADANFKDLNTAWDKAYEMYKEFLTDKYGGNLPYKYNLPDTILKDYTERDKLIDFLNNNVKDENLYSKIRLYISLYNHQSSFEQANDLSKEFVELRSKYDKDDPLTEILNYLFAGNPISKKFLDWTGTLELRVRGTSILADLLMAYNKNMDDILKLFRKIPSSDFKKASRKFTVNLDEAESFSNSFNYDYENRPRGIQILSKAIPFPIFFIKNAANWLHMLLQYPELADTILTIQDGMWSDDEDEESAESDEFAAAAKGRGAIPFGHKSSNFKGYLKPSPLQSFFSAFNTINNPVQDLAYRITPFAAPLTHHLQDKKDVKYRPYGTGRFDKNVKYGDKNFSKLKYTFHRLNPYERLIQTWSRVPDKSKNNDIQLSDILPSTFQPNFSKTKKKKKS